MGKVHLQFRIRHLSRFSRLALASNEEKTMSYDGNGLQMKRTL